MKRALGGKVSELIFLYNPLFRIPQSSVWSNPSTIPPLFPIFSSIHADAGAGGFDDESHHQNPPNPIPNRPLRGQKPIYHSLKTSSLPKDTNGDDNTIPSPPNNKTIFRGANGNGAQDPQSSISDLFSNKFNTKSLDDGKKMDEKMTKSSHTSPVQFLNTPFAAEKGEDQSEAGFLEQFKLGVEKRENKPHQNATTQLPKEEETNAYKQDADEIFKKMKETGLIPNAVAMLDGLCKDGLVQEAMKLFGLMREKGTIPEVVIYTAVVDGFCKAHKLDDAMRIFRKMQNNGISPNAFSYTVLIQGLYKVKRLEDAVDFCMEMLEAGHSPNVATFAGLVDGFCREKGVEEAQSIIGRLRQKGIFLDDKAVREYLDRKGPFLPLVWEAIFGKKSSQRSF